MSNNEVIPHVWDEVRNWLPIAISLFEGIIYFTEGRLFVSY